MAATERRVENADGTMDLANLPPDLQQRIREQKQKYRKGQITLAEARRRTAELMREMSE